MSILPQPACPDLPTRSAALRRHLTADERGATAIEYALIAAGIGAAVAATVYSLGTSLASLYQSVASAF